MGTPKPSWEEPKERQGHITEEHNHEAGRPAWPPEAAGLSSKGGEDKAFQELETNRIWVGPRGAYGGNPGEGQEGDLEPRGRVP